ncbi:TetR/AcrR family transcriptional regulator [Pseudoduganella violaceinigra]|uniref:TetR/AcrR family transcriptional regulator n=1 Tax=Pseudoduganella violaceinigra TaxID=246602 RepID=UPI0004284199|nr:TetR/AcrR family transcriptional regulator [Pseudoduganella violaceinigra]
MRVSREQAAQNRERIVETASRLFREKGYDGIGVADLMKSAGLTHGGFYGHFASKEDLLAEAFGKAMAHSAERWSELLAAEPANPRAALAHMYLTSEHRDNPGQGCALAALGPDVSRVGPEVRQAMGDSFQKQLAALAEALPGDPAQQRRDAITTYAAMVGGLVLARSVANKKQSDEILAAVLSSLEESR